MIGMKLVNLMPFSLAIVRVQCRMVTEAVSASVLIQFLAHSFLVSENIQKQIGLDPGYYTIPKCRANLLKYTPKREDLPSRSMTDSFTTAILPLSSSSYRERYVNHLRRVRMGRLMEELDLFAGK